MRLTFPNGEHAAVDIEHGQTGVGSASGGGTTVTIPGLAPLHAIFAAGRRGHWLTVPKDATVIVNARPVKRLAFLRPGDLVCLGGVQVRLQSDTPPPTPSPDPALSRRQRPVEPAATPRATLRGLNGAWFGRCLPVTSTKLLGSAIACDVRIDGDGVLERHAQIALEDGGVVVRGLSAAAILRVNGHLVLAASLTGGDQVELGDQRFVLESAGVKATKARADAPLPKPDIRDGKGSSTMRLPEEAPPLSHARRDLGGIYLLVAAAAALAAALTAFFVYAPR